LQEFKIFAAMKIWSPELLGCDTVCMAQ